MKKNIRTDLALESHEITMSEAGRIDGVVVRNFKKGKCQINRLEVLNKDGEKAIGKAIGNYVTIEAPHIKYNSDEFETVSELCALEIRKLADITPETKTFVIGLGNRGMTPDAIGPKVVDEIMVTGNMTEYYRKVFGEGVGDVCAISPGVLGTTGIETLDTIKALTKKLMPDLIIVADALAAAELDRLCTTIQISDAGILPGSGVGNNRRGINKETLGIPVIAIGVPTVIDAYNICDIEIPESIAPMFVTVKDIDFVVKKMSSAVAASINLALNNGVTLRDIMCFVG